MKNRELLLSAMSDMEEQFLMEAYDYERERRSLTPRVRRILIAAAVVAALAITAGAVGLGLHQAARDDLGISEPEQVSGYAEYAVKEPTAAPELTQDPEMPWQWHSSGTPQLVSALSGDGRVTAYLSVPGVTREMENALQGYEGFWDVGTSSSARQIGVEQTAYDAQNETALVKVVLEKLPAGTEAESFTLIYRFEGVTPSFDDGSLLAEVDGADRRERMIVYEPVTIPLTQSASLHAALDIPAAHPKLDALKARLVDVDVCADGVSVTLQAPSYEALQKELGDGAWRIFAEAAFGALPENYPAESDLSQEQLSEDEVEEAIAIDAYHGLFYGLMNTVQDRAGVMDGAALNLKDGSSLVLAELENRFAATWVCSEDGYESGVWRFHCALQKVLELDKIESFTVCGETYPLSEE